MGLRNLKHFSLLSAVLAIISIYAYTPAESKSVSISPVPQNYTTSSATTFKVCEKVPEKVQSRPNLLKNVHLATHLKEFRKNNCIRVIQGTNFASAVEPSHKNGFITTVIDAYNGHHNLVIRPDDVWTAIVLQFSLYVNANSERFRKRFVNFDDKKTLVVDLGVGSLDTVSYSYFVNEMTKKIHENIVDDEIRNWILPNFSTTTEDDKISTGVILMATLKKYFNYVGTIACGIPQITLEGTVDDWRNIAGRLEKLKTYKLEKWVDLLEPIIAQFINAKSGNIDKEFWNSMVTVQTVGCGSTDISGWITVFSVYNDEGKWQAYIPKGEQWPQFDIESIVSGVAQVDVTIDDNGLIYDTVMFAGHMGREILRDGFTLQPRIGWAIALKNSTEAARPSGSPWPGMLYDY